MAAKQSELDLKSDIKKLVLLDGMALTYRAHFALIRSPRFTSGGVCTSAVFGVLNTIQDIIKREEPTHLAVALDTSDPTARHELFPEYKAQRDEMPEDISKQLPLIEKLYEAYNITRIKMPGYEADDIIGTIAHQAADDGFEVIMVTPDKDYEQLVRENVWVMKPGRKGGEVELFGVEEVLEKWGIERVEQVIDVLGLMGDSSDNIPGVPGIGPKTAQKLIAEYGSTEALIERSDELKGKQKERVQEHVEQAFLSKKLVTIQMDVPHEVEIAALSWKSFDEKKLKPFLEELEFDSVGKRIFGKSFSSSASRTKVIREKREQEIQASLFDELPDETTLEDVPHQYHLVDNAEQRAALIEKLKAAKEFCFDSETTSKNPRTATPLGLAFALKPGEAFYVRCPSDPKEAKSTLEEFRCVFEDEAIAKVGHNLKYDLSLLKWHGIDVRGSLFDTQLAQSMKEPEMNRGLDYLAKLYLRYTPVSYSEVTGGEDKTLADVPIEKVVDYAAEDADVTLQVANVIRPDIDSQGVANVCYQVECPLVQVLVDMEFEGIRLDAAALADYSEVLARDISDLRQKIFDAAGREFNIDSPKQLGVVLYDELQLEENPKKTKTGQYSTREAELERLSHRHEIIANILDYRNAVKLKSVYVDQLPEAVYPSTGRLHTEYEQAWTTTGRMQSNNPNLQTIPVRKKRGREIRAAFVARDDDYLLLAADYSQIELRVMAHLSQDPALVEAFRNDEDIHTVTASKVYKVDPEDVTREMRDKAKTVNFGIIYGISAFGLQQRLNIPRAEAKELIDNYFEKYPGVQEYIDRTIEFAREHGYVETQMGRRRYLRDINSKSRTLANAAERLAMNSPIQGTAADILKLAMIRVHRVLREGGYKSKMLLTVHDEIVFDLYREEEETAIAAIREAMSGAMELSVPLKVECGVGNNWLEAH
ncbi:MAG: DNA polymerase I [Pirellulaceae bacterium]